MQRIINFKAITVVFFAIAIALAACVYYIFSFDTQGIVKEQMVVFETLRLQVLIRANTVGMGGSTQIKILGYSVDRNQRIEASSHELINLYGSELYYKKENESTLALYVSSQSIPKDQKAELHFGQLTILVNELKSREAEAYRINYERYGLKKIDLYE